MEKKLLTPAQCLMARSFLRLSYGAFARAARVGKSTVIRFEEGQPTIPATTIAIQAALEDRGFSFRDDGSLAPPADVSKPKREKESANA
jgi:hypothetical protein